MTDSVGGGKNTEPIASPQETSSSTGSDTPIPPRMKEIASAAKEREKPLTTIGSGVRKIADIAEKAWAHMDDGRRVQALREANEASGRLTVKRLWGNSGVLEEHRSFVDNKARLTPDQLKIVETLKLSLGTGDIHALYGKPGVGKTQILACMVWCACRDGRTGLYLHAGAMHAGLHAASQNANIEEAMNRYREPHLLAVDEIGRTSRASTLFPVELTRLVDWRHSAGKCTLFASNLAEPDLRAELGDSLCQRMKSGGGFIHMDGPSFRGVC